jgi:isocitrate dehydrogenase
VSNGKHLTEDIARSTEVGSTTEFTDALINNLGKQHVDWQQREYKKIIMVQPPIQLNASVQHTVGVDVFIQDARQVEALAKSIEASIAKTAFSLKMIGQRGMQVYPNIGGIVAANISHYQCRFVSKKGGSVSEEEIQKLIHTVLSEYYWVHLERLQNIGVEAGFTRLQGES